MIKRIEHSHLNQVRNLHMYCTDRQWSDRTPTEGELSFYTPKEILGVFQGEKLLSMIRNYTFNQSVRGTMKKMGGVSHVATFPEHRLCGHAKELTKASFLDMKEKGQVVSMLHPFKEGFYSKFGYVSSNDNLSVCIPLDGFAQYLKKKDSSDGEWREKRVRAVDVQEEFENFKSRLDLVQNHGMVFLNLISEEYWKEDHENVIVVFIEKDNKIMAAAKYILIKSGDNKRVFVPEMYWQNFESRERLFRYFAKHIDQFHKIEMRIPFEVNFFPWLGDTMRPIDVNIKDKPWMVRVIDVVGAVEDINVSIDEKITIEIKDEYCKWNNGTYNLSSVNNKLKMIRCESGKSSVEMDIKGFTSLLYGVYSVEELQCKGWISLCDSYDKRLLDKWFPKLFINNLYYY